MKKKTLYLALDSTRPVLRLSWLVTLWLLLDRLHAPPLVWGIVGTLAILLALLISVIWLRTFSADTIDIETIDARLTTLEQARLR